MSRDGWSVVSSLLRGEEAEMLAGLLESAGIESLVDDAGIASLNPLLQSAVGGAKVLVPSADAARAREIIEASGVFVGGGGGDVGEIPEAEWSSGGDAVPASAGGDVAEPTAVDARRDAESRRALRLAVVAVLFSWTLVVPLLAIANAARLSRAARTATAPTRARARWAVAVAALSFALGVALWTAVVPRLVADREPSPPWEVPPPPRPPFP